MGVNNLMVGDYILVDNEVCKVTAIYSNGTIGYEGNDVSGNTDNPQPIPITTDGTCIDIILRVKNAEEQFYELPFKIKYVHEQQHLYKLLGDDL